MSAAIITCCHAAPVFQPAKHIFNLMPLFVEGFAVSGGKISTFSWRDTGHYSFGFECRAEFVTVVTFIAKQMGGAGR